MKRYFVLSLCVVLCLFYTGIAATVLVHAFADESIRQSTGAIAFTSLAVFVILSASLWSVVRMADASWRKDLDTVSQPPEIISL
jgi:hypothetical protein